MKLAVTYLLALWLGCAFGGGEVCVLHSSPGLAWSGGEPLRASLVREVVSASLGLSVRPSRPWSGLAVRDPFAAPKAALLLKVDGPTGLAEQPGVARARYPLLADGDVADTFDAMRRRLAERFPTADDLAVAEELQGDGRVYPVGERSALRPQVDDEDRRFLADLSALQSMGARFVSDDRPRFYYVSLSSLHPLSDLHGPTSPATVEAEALLAEAVRSLTSAFQKAYEGEALVLLVTSDASHTRRARNVLEESSASRIHLFNIAKTYTANYPVIFNIIFWFTVALILTLIAVTYTIADMDPGRDSIIYRMTSNRMKKDN